MNETTADILQYCKENNITNYTDFLKWCKENKKSWYRIMCAENEFDHPIGDFIKSQR